MNKLLLILTSFFFLHFALEAQETINFETITQEKCEELTSFMEAYLGNKWEIIDNDIVRFPHYHRPEKWYEQPFPQICESAILVFSTMKWIENNEQFPPLVQKLRNLDPDFLSQEEKNKVLKDIESEHGKFQIALWIFFEVDRFIKQLKGYNPGTQIEFMKYYGDNATKALQDALSIQKNNGKLQKIFLKKDMKNFKQYYKAAVALKSQNSNLDTDIPFYHKEHLSRVIQEFKDALQDNPLIHLTY